jgi:hypothetical protein
MRSERTPFLLRVERTLRIGLGVKGSSQLQVGLPELGRRLEPLRPFVADEKAPVDFACFFACFHEERFYLAMLRSREPLTNAEAAWTGPRR